MSNLKQILERAAVGFEARRRLLRLKSRKASGQIPDSEEAHSQGGLIDLTAISGRYLRKDIPLGQYISEMKSLLPAQYHDLILGYYFSGSYVQNPMDLLREAVGDDAEFSIIVQTLVLSRRIGDQVDRDLINWHLSVLIKDIVGKRSLPTFEEFASLHALFAKLAEPPDRRIETLSEFNQFISGVKGDLVPILGPDIFTVFQELFDPDRLITEQDIDRMFDVGAAWGCGDLIARLLLVRATRNTPGDDVGLDAMLAESLIRESLSSKTLKLCEAWSSSEVPSVRRGAGSLSRAIAGICKIRSAIDQGSAWNLIDEVVNLYNVDPSLMEWLDWEGIYRTIRSSPRQVGVKSCIIHLLMGENYVGRKFPVVAFAEGDGAFESALRTTVNDLPERTLDGLCGELRKLTGKSQELIVSAIVAPEAAAMLAILLQYQPTWAKQLTTGGELAYDIRASGLRSDLATTLVKHGLIEQERGQSIFDEEQARLRVAYLQRRQLEGLVHVDWDRVERLLDREFSGPLALVRQMLVEPNLENRKSYLVEVVDALADRATRLVLIDGPDNLKTTISDALRHGQLRNRFLLAFDRAASNVAMMQGYGSIDFRTLTQMTEGRSSEWLIRLRATLVEHIRDYNAASLSVGDESRLRRRMLTAAAASFTASINDRIGFGPLFVSRMKIELSAFFEIARAQLSKSIDRYMKSVEKISGSAKRLAAGSTDGSKILDKSQFILALREQISEARRDALSWVALTDRRQDPEPFDFSDLVQLCLINHRPDSARELSVTAVVSEWRPDKGTVILPKPPQIRGKYFLFLETVVKNILANAFAHSGLALNTRISIELSTRKNRLEIRSRNNLGRVRYRSLQRELPRVQLELNDKNLAAAANDSGSGLHKVRWAFKRSLGSLPAINLSLSSKSPIIDIEIQARHNEGQIFV